MIFLLKCQSNFGCLFRCAKTKSASNQLSDSTFQLDNANECSHHVLNHIIIDLTLVQFIDEAAMKTLREIGIEYSKEKVNIYLTNCSSELILPFILNSNLNSKILFKLLKRECNGFL